MSRPLRERDIQLEGFVRFGLMASPP